MSSGRSGRLNCIDDRTIAALHVVGDADDRVVDDLAVVDLVARFAVEARASGCVVRVAGARPTLLEMLEFAGLADVLGVQPGGQPEEREELGVEEVLQGDDPPV